MIAAILVRSEAVTAEAAPAVEVEACWAAPVPLLKAITELLLVAGLVTMPGKFEEDELRVELDAEVVRDESEDVGEGEFGKGRNRK
jgi:hypothetical protein